MSLYREIKFRAWMDNKYLFFDLKKQSHENGFFGDCVCHDYEIEQFTGLKDKNGVEIYEGDILLFAESERKGRVYYDTDSAQFMYGDYQFNYFEGVEDCEVIGNVWKNPELLK